MASIQHWDKFSSFELAYDNEVISRSLSFFCKAIKECARHIEEAEASDNEGYTEAIIDEETAQIENLLGIAFVLCQSYITLLVSQIISLHKIAEELDTKLTTTNGKKREIVKLGSNVISGTECTEVQAIDAFANYFKHREEWSGSWDQPKGRASDTVEVLQAIGAQQFSTGNFRIAFERLGNESYENLLIFTDILDKWGREVHKRYRAELKQKGLL